MLSSYEVIRWNLILTDSIRLLAVYVNSHQPQSTVSGLDTSVPIIFQKPIPFAYEFLPTCRPQFNQCTESGFEALKVFVTNEFSAHISSFSAEYNPISLSLPGMTLDSAKYQEIEDQSTVLRNASRNLTMSEVFSEDTAATWAEHFAPSNSQIPTGHFRGFYFNDKTPNILAYSDSVNHPAIDYSYSEFHGLDAANFAGYWIGHFEYATLTQVLMTITSQGHDETAIFIDHVRIPLPDNPTSVTYSMAAGTHLIEVQHLNNWHTIHFNVTLEPMP